MMNHFSKLSQKFQSFLSICYLINQSLGRVIETWVANVLFIINWEVSGLCRHKLWNNTIFAFARKIKEIFNKGVWVLSKICKFVIKLLRTLDVLFYVLILGVKGRHLSNVAILHCLHLIIDKLSYLFLWDPNFDLILNFWLCLLFLAHFVINSTFWGFGVLGFWGFGVLGF